MKITEVLMTPADAQRLLDSGGKNRLVSPHRVNLLSASMASGHWHNDGNPVKVSDAGHLIDGQHRLKAVVQSGVTVPMIILEGLPAQAHMTIDTGRPRSFADYLRMEGVTDPPNKAAATRLLWNYRSGGLVRGIGFESVCDIQSLWDLYKADQEDIEAGIAVARHVQSRVNVLRSCVAVAHIVLSGINSVDTEGFFAELAMDVAPDDAQSAPFVLARQFNAPHNDYRGRSGTHEQRLMMALLIKAWNFYREGRSVDMVVWRQGGKHREKFPEPKPLPADQAA